MTTTYYTLSNGTETTMDVMLKCLAKQVADIPALGEVNVFGETVTAEDVAHSLSEVSRVASVYAAMVRAA